MVRLHIDGEYGGGGADEEDVGKMPDQVGNFVPLYIWKNTRKRKNNKKEKKSDRGHEETVGFADVRSELRGK